MRLLQGLPVLVLLSAVAIAQQTSNPQPVQTAQSTAPAAPSAGTVSGQQFRMVKGLIKRELKKAIDGRPYPEIKNWHPLTTREKFNVFLKHTYAPGTFAGAGIDALKGNIKARNREYETGWRGLGQRAGI